MFIYPCSSIARSKSIIKIIANIRKAIVIQVMDSINAKILVTAEAIKRSRDNFSI